MKSIERVSGSQNPIMKRKLEKKAKDPGLTSCIYYVSPHLSH